MKKVISVLLSVIVFLGGIVCPKISAGGVDKEVYLKDGTKLTYISSKKMYKAKEWIEGKIKENREKIFSVAANTGIKLGSAVIGTLAGMASNAKVESPYLRAGLATITVLVTLSVFFYPDYVRYDVDKNENHYTDEFRFHGWFNGKASLTKLEDCIDDYIYHIEEGHEIGSEGIIIVERPAGYGLQNHPYGTYSGIYDQDEYYPDRLEVELNYEIENKL